MSLDTRLASYGTLAPGQPNHHHVSLIGGTWRPGIVHGTVVAAGWAADLGFPALTLDPEGPAVAVQLLEAAELPDHWQRLDDFEGSDYRRVVTSVQTEAGTVDAWIYVNAYA